MNRNSFKWHFENISIEVTILSHETQNRTGRHWYYYKKKASIINAGVLLKTIILIYYKHTLRTVLVLKRGILCENTHAPWVHGANTLLHADLAQPVSEVFQNTSLSSRSNQYLYQHKQIKHTHTSTYKQHSYYWNTNHHPVCFRVCSVQTHFRSQPEFDWTFILFFFPSFLPSRILLQFSLTHTCHWRWAPSHSYSGCELSFWETR